MNHIKNNIFDKIKNIFNSSDKKRLVSNFFSLSLLQGFTYVLPLLTLPYLVRVLGINLFGKVEFAQSFIVFFHILVDFGFNLSATREISVHREDKNKITEIFSSIMIIKLFLVIFSLTLMSIIIFCFNEFKVDWQLYYLTFLWVIGQALFPVWYFQGLEKMKYITIVNIFAKIIFTVLIFVFIKSHDDYILVPFLNGLGLISSGILSLIIVKKIFKQEFKLYGYKILKGYFIESSHFFLSRVAITIYTTSNIFVLGIFTNSTMVGYYSVAEKLYRALQQLYQPLVQTLYPYVSKEKNIKLFKKVFKGVVVSNIVIAFLLFILGQNIFDLLFTQKIGEDSLRVFHILLIAIAIVVPSILMGYPFLGALGYKKYANISVIYGSIIHLLGLCILIFFDSISIYSVAFMVVITEFLVFSSRVYWTRSNNLWS